MYRYLDKQNSSALLIALVIVSWAVKPGFSQVFMDGRQDVVAMYLYNGQSEQQFKKRIESSAEMRLKLVTSAIKLDADQASKLRFALKGDINRFYRELDAIRKKTEGLDVQNQNDMQKAWEAVAPVYERVQNGPIFDDTCLMERVLRECLSEEQRGLFEDMERSRRESQFVAVVKASIAELEKQVPILSKQRQELLDLMMEMDPPVSAGQNMQAYVGFVAMTRVDGQRLKAIFDKQQLKALNKMLQQYKHFGGIEWE